MAPYVANLVGKSVGAPAITPIFNVETLETAYQLARTDGVTMLIFGTESGLQRIVESRAAALWENRDRVSGDYREPAAPPNPTLY